MGRPKNPFGDPVSVYRRGSRWAVRYYPTGLVTSSDDRQVLPESYGTKEDAERVAEALRQELYKLRAASSTPATKPDQLLSAVLEDYVKEQKKDEHTPTGTVRKRISTVRLYVMDSEAAAMPVRHLPGRQAELIVRTMRRAKKADGSPKGENTIDGAERALAHCGRWLAKEGYSVSNPFAEPLGDKSKRQEDRRVMNRQRAVARVTRERPEDEDGDADRGIGLEDVPSPETCLALRDAISRRETLGPPDRRSSGPGSKGGAKPLSLEAAQPVADSVLLRSASGLRTCEALVVHTSRIRFDEGIIVVDRQLDRYKLWVPGEEPPMVPPKHNKERDAQVWSMFLEPLEEWAWRAERDTGGWLVAPSRAQRNWAVAYEDAVDRGIGQLQFEHEHGIEVDGSVPPVWTWKPHYLRHTYGSYSLASQEQGGMGWSLTLVAESMAHGSERTTADIYRHVTTPERAWARKTSFAWEGVS
jgi:hypothetical protein